MSEALLSVLIAGAQALVAEALGVVVRRDCVVRGIATDFVQLGQLMQRYPVDVVIVYADGNEWNESSTLGWICAFFPSTAILFLNSQPSALSVAEKNAGVLTHALTAAANREDLLRTLAMIGTQLPASSATVRREAPDERSPRWEAGGSSTRRNVRLTQRQTNILSMIADGESTKSTAAKLGISVRTVEFHKYRLMKNLNVTTTSDLIRFAYENGMVRQVATDFLFQPLTKAATGRMRVP